MRAIWSDIVLLGQLIAAALGFTVYVASYFGYEWEACAQLLLIAFACSFLMSIPISIRDLRYFKKYWGFGFIGVRKHFPFQMFPARDVEWLNPLAWSSMIIILLHFAALVAAGSNHNSSPSNISAYLRNVSLMLTFTGMIGALTWIYPPTEKPGTEDIDSPSSISDS